MPTWTPTELLSLTPHGDEGGARNARLRGDLRSEPDDAGRHRRRRRRPEVGDLLARSSARWPMPNAGDELHHFGWNACSSCLCPNAPHPHMERRYLVVPGLRSSRIHILDTKPDPSKPQDRQGHRAGGARRQGRLYPPAHRALRPGGHLRRRRSATARARVRRHLPDGSRNLRRARPVGDRPRAAAPRLRRLVAPRARHAGHERMGHARHVRERPHPRAAARRQVRPHACTSGICTSASTCRPSTSATSTSWCSSCGRRTIRPRPTASSTASISLEDLSASIWIWYRDGDKWAVEEGDRDPRRAGERGRPAAAAQGLQGRAAAGHRHRPVDGRPLPLRLLLGHRRSAAVRRLRPVQPQADRQGADRRHRVARPRTPAPRTAR